MAAALMSDTNSAIPMPQSPAVDLKTGYPTLPWYRYWNQPQFQSVDFPGKISNTDNLPEGEKNLYFTAARASEAVAQDFQDSDTIAVNYAGGILTAELIPSTIGLGGSLLQYGFDIYGRMNKSNPASTTNLPEGTNLYYTNERAQDAIGAAIEAGTQEGISVTYDGASHTINFIIDPAEFGSKEAVSYASTSALPANTYNNGASGVGATLTGSVNGPLVIDGVTLVTGNLGDRVLVAAESTSANNGWYTITQVGVIAVSPYIMTRSTDADQGYEIASGYLTGVEAPSGITPGSNNGKVFISVAPDPFVVGTSSLLFSIVGNTYTAGTGLTLSGNQFALANTGVAPSTYGDATHVATFTVDAQGRLVAASPVAIVFPAADLATVWCYA